MIYYLQNIQKNIFQITKMLVKYLNDFYIKNNLNVEFNSEVKK